ncbi:MAG: hypothetical protein ABI614_26460 [Planctomycetota bacterium]
MAKKKARRKSGVSDVNKTALITEALTQDPDASPTAVAASVGNDVTPKYVSTIKTKLRSAHKKTAKKKPGRPKGSKNAATNAVAGTGSLSPAIAFIEAAGGLAAAKRQIETIERIKQL